MAATTLSKENTLTVSPSALKEAFTEEFPEDVIKKVDGFDNVSPHFYRQRLVDNLAFDYDVLVNEPILLGKSVVSVKTTVILPNGKQSQANGTAVISDANGEVSAQGVLYAVREAQSTGLKLALTNFGMGLHLYFGHDDEDRPSRATQKAPVKSKPAPEPKEDEEETPPPKRSTKASNDKSDWSSKREKFTVPIGKNKGQSYAEVEASWLSWADENLEDGEKNEKLLKCVRDEIKYRKNEGTYNPDAGRKKFSSNKPTKKRSISDETEDQEDF